MADNEEWITPTEAARRVVQRGYAKTMTRQRIYQLAADDPAWPAPRDQWRTFGAYKMLPWGAVERYFKERDARPGRPAKTERVRQSSEVQLPPAP
jgi:hypothetical protein